MGPHQPHSHQVPAVLVQVISKETTTGSTTCIRSSHRVLKVPAINGDGSITKDKFDNLSGCQEPFIDGIKWTTDDDYGGGSRLWQRGQALCPGPEGVWGHIIIMEIYTINTLQEAREGYE